MLRFPRSNGGIISVTLHLYRPRMPTSTDLPASRRQFLALSASTLAIAACTRRIPSLSQDREAPFTLFIGSYTKSGTSRGIYRATVDRHSLRFGEATLAATTSEPSFLVLAPNGRTLVAVNELLTLDGEPAGSVSAFAYDRASGMLTPTGSARSSRGAAPCYVSFDRTGRFVFVANYVGGNISVLPLGIDGALGDVVQVVAHVGSGPNATRQNGPHAHCIVLDASNRFAIAADLGADRLFVYRFDERTGRLEAAATSPFALPAGAGPRHVVFSPDGGTAYCANELDSTLSVFTFDAGTGALRARQTLSTRPAGATGDNAPADIHVHPNGRTVYLSNRGDNTMAVFRVRPDTGALELAQTIASGGNWPRNFTLTPDARGLLVAHQRSDSVVAFRIDGDGLLQAAGPVLQTPVPVCLLFA